MKLGGTVLASPTYYSNSGLERVIPQEAKVVYVNEAHCYYTMEFTVNGHKFRESFKYIPKGRKT